MEFGGYEIQEELARGAMGVVYRAHDPRIGRDVAIKLLQAGQSHPTQLERFLREGRITASLDHPGILRVHAAGERNGRPFLVYELIDGARTFATAAGHLPLRGRLELLRDAAAALGHAHAQGVLHRDVKPENVLVDAEGRARVADFGLATARGLSRLTRTGATLGTLQYMSPEQFEADRERIGPPSDVWSLGVMLYEAITGALPFAAETIVELGGQLAAGLDQPPSRRTSDSSPALDAVCLRALTADPARRYPTAAELALDLEATLRGEEPWALRTARRARRRRLATLGLSLALALGLVAAAARADPPRRGTGPRLPRPAARPAAVVATPAPEPAAQRLRRLEVARQGPILRRRVLVERTPVRVAFVGARTVAVWSDRQTDTVELYALGAERLEKLGTWGGAPQLHDVKQVVPAGAGAALVFDLRAAWLLDPQSDRLERIWGSGGDDDFAAAASHVGPQGTTFALGGHRGLVLVDGTSRPLRPRIALGSRVRRAHFGPQGRRLAWVVGARLMDEDHENAAYALDLDRPEAAPRRWALPELGGAVLYDHDRDRVLVGLGPTLVAYGPGPQAERFLEAPADEVSRDVKLRSAHAAHGVGQVAGLALCPDGHTAISLASTGLAVSSHSELRAWDLRRDAPSGHTLRWDGPAAWLDLSPDGEWLAVGAFGELQVWWAPALTTP